MSEFEAKRSLVGCANFVRHNPMTDRFDIIRYHHIEFWCLDATNVSRRFTWGLGMPEVAKSDLTSGNKHYACSVVQSNEIVFAFTAPYNHTATMEGSTFPHPRFDKAETQNFILKHGLAVRALGIRVGDARVAFARATEGGAIGVCPPVDLVDSATGKTMTVSEIKHVDDTVMRFVSGDYDGPFLPNMTPVQSPNINYGLTRIDHCVTNVPKMFDTIDYLMNAVGFHEFGEFTAADVGTLDSGLNSMVLASNNEMVLIPVNEPTFGTKRQSQVQTYLEHNAGAGIQHIAVKTDDIFETMRELSKRKYVGGFEFMPAPNQFYYDRVPQRIGADVLTAAQLKELQELGLLADKDDQGVLLQVFTKPLGDRPTCFFEIIQRLGCDRDEQGRPKEQTAGCGGFGKGNFGELFRSLEEFEKTFVPPNQA